MAHFIAQQRHAASHTTTLAAAEHGDLQADFAVAGGNSAGIGMVAMHGQAAMVAEGLVVIQGLLEAAWSWAGIWRSSGVSRRCSSPIAAYLRWGIGRASYPHFITKTA